MTDQEEALVTIDPHSLMGPIILHSAAHVIVHTDVMAVEVHICFIPAKVVTACDGSLDIEGCYGCGGDHHYLTAAEYLNAAERQDIPVDYI